VGGAFSAVCDDATAPYWNPAGTVYLPFREVVVQHAEQFGSLLNHDFASVVIPIRSEETRRIAIGASLIRLAADGIPVTPRPGALKPGLDFRDDGPDRDPATPDPGTNNGVWDVGEELLLDASSFFSASSADYAVLLSIARQRGRHWALGANLKFVRQSLPDTLPGEDVTAFGAGADVGVLYMPTDAVTLSASVHDLTTTYLAWSNGTRENIIPTLDTGVSFAFRPADRQALTWAVDVAWGFQRRRLDSQLSAGGQTWDLRTGLEYWYHDLFALRAGANGKDLAFGAGVRYRHLGIDYAASLHRFFAGDDSQFPDDTDLDATHIVSAGWSW
jgi:hypothetical protein